MIRKNIRVLTCYLEMRLLTVILCIQFGCLIETIRDETFTSKYCALFLSKESYSNINLDFLFKCLSLGFYVFVFSFCGHSNFITDAGKLNILRQKHTVNFSYTFEINRNTLYIYSKCETDRVGWTKQFIRMRREQFLFLIILSSANLNSLPRNNNRNWKFFVNVLSNAYVLRKTF